MNRFLLTVCLSGMSILGFGQLSISGVVCESGSRPLAGATVQILESKHSAVTDEFGAFRFDRMPAGNYEVLFKFLGMRDHVETVVLREDARMEVVMEENPILTEEVIVHATRANENTPTTFINVAGPTLQKQNFGQDLPYLLNWTPSVVTTSDAGAGIGYTGIRIRGSDATRVNVTINGIPYNDSESQSTYWVDIPDVASSTQSIQVQRGVGTSTNGAAAFGASINLQTTSMQADPYGELVAAGGSFASQRFTIRAGTGLINKRWALDVKASTIKSDGYIDRASADLGSYYMSAGYFGDKTIIKAITFGGTERTYQSWYGVDEATLESNRTMNYAGALYDSQGQISGYYKNQVDDYRQDHYQLHATHQFTDAWSMTASMHYTTGKGFYEEYHQGRTFASVGLPDITMTDTTLSASDMVVRKWLDNKFYGATFNVQYQGEKSNWTLGGAFHHYGKARHFGEIIWSQYAGSIPPEYTYYDGHSDKGDGNVFLKWNYRINDRLNSFVDVQYRYVNYTTVGVRDDQSSYSVDDQFNFFNPKAGLSYRLSEKNVLYTSFAVANREPNRTDYLENTTRPKPERLHNLELGLRRNTKLYAFEVNYYLMNYTDQLVQTGAIDATGNPIRENVGSSYRTGLEFSGGIRLSDRWNWNANVTWSINQNNNYLLFENGLPVTRNTTIILSPGIIGGSQLSWKPIATAEIVWLSKYVGSQYLDNEQSDNVKLSDYWVNDLRMSYTWSPGGVKSIVWSLLLNNVLDTKYSSNGYGYGGTPYFFPQAGRSYMAMMTVRF